MNGVELARKVHEKNPAIPVIIVTGYGPIDGGKDVSACLQKEELFPSAGKNQSVPGRTRAARKK